MAAWKRARKRSSCGGNFGTWSHVLDFKYESDEAETPREVSDPELVAVVLHQYANSPVEDLTRVNIPRQSKPQDPCEASVCDF